jgi:hypothetical protein
LNTIKHARQNTVAFTCLWRIIIQAATGKWGNTPLGTDKLMAVERQSLDENIQVAVQTPPISSRDHSTRSLALPSIQLKQS